jgi:membrane protein YdbS with pleckstrin-like domain
MRISENSYQRLVLRDESIWITAICIAAAAVLVVASLLAGAGRASPWVSLLFILFGLAFLRSSTITFDKVEQACHLSKLSSLKRSRAHIPFADIQDVEIQPEPLNADSQQTSYRLSLTTASGGVPLSDTYEPNFARYSEIRRAILQMLNRQDALAAQPDPVRSLVEQGRLVDAVALLRQREGLDLATARQRVAEMQKSANGD